jgi:hypothetical protein
MAGALSIILFHESGVFVLGKLGLVQYLPWRMEETVPPLNVPVLVGQSLWGALWGILFALLIDDMPRVPTWVNGLSFGLALPMLAASWLLVPLIRSRPLMFGYFTDFDTSRLGNSFLLDGVAFGTGLGIIYGWLPSRGDREVFPAPDPASPGNIPGYLILVAGLVLMYAAISGLVLKGPDTSPMLALVGVGLLVFGVNQLVRASNWVGAP